MALLFSSITFKTGVARAATLPAYRYTQTFDTSSGSAESMGVATDPSGNVYVTGYFSGTVNFAGASGNDTQTALGGGADDTFITKYNANGSYAWTKIFDTSHGWANGDAITTDAQGDIYAAGQFSQTVVFDGAGGNDSQTDTSGVSDSYLTKYNANGSYAWTKTFDASSGSAQGLAVATDGQGDAYLTGVFAGTVVFDGAGGSDSQNAGTTPDTFTTKYASDGSYIWTRTFDVTNGASYGESIAVDSQGNVYAGGSFIDTVVFDGAGGSDSRTELSGDGDTYITEYDANGNYKNTKSFTTSPSGYSYGATGLAVDSQGNVYALGAISGTVTFANGDTQTANRKGETTLTKYNANGSYAWSKVFDDSGGWSYGQSVATDSLGDVYIAGQFYQTVDFNGTSDPHVDTAGVGDAYLVKYNADGSYAWAQTHDIPTSGSYSWGQGVATDAFGNVVTVGGFVGTVTFDGVGGSDTQTSAGGSPFLTSYAAFVPAPIVTTQKQSSSTTSTTSTHTTAKPATQYYETQAQTPALSALIPEEFSSTTSTTSGSSSKKASSPPAKHTSAVIRNTAIGLIVLCVAYFAIAWRKKRKRASTS